METTLANLGVVDYIAIVTTILTILSVCLNIIQWLQRAEFQKALKSRSQATYNYFFLIARRATAIRELDRSQEKPEAKLQTAISLGNNINGIADSARSDIVAYSREHLNFLPFEEHPARPIADPSKIQRYFIYSGFDVLCDGAGKSVDCLPRVTGPSIILDVLQP